jgi:PAS domain S-box-containing protein
MMVTKKKNFNNEEYQNILEAVSAVAIIAYTNRNGKITYANENFCKISGYTMAELYKKDHRLLNSGLHDKSFFEKMYETISQRKIWRGEVRNKRKDGTLYWVDTQIIPIINEDNEIESYASIRFDITERKQMDEAMMEMEKLNASLEIAKSVAHEINNPLTIIELSCQSLNRELNELSPSLSTRKKIFKIMEQSKRIALIIKELKSFSAHTHAIKKAS